MKQLFIGTLLLTTLSTQVYANRMAHQYKVLFTECEDRVGENSAFSRVMQEKKDTITEKFLTGKYGIKADQVLEVDYTHISNKPGLKEKSKAFGGKALVTALSPVLFSLSYLLEPKELTYSSYCSVFLDKGVLGQGEFSARYLNKDNKECVRTIKVDGDVDIQSGSTCSKGVCTFHNPEGLNYNIKLKSNKKLVTCEE